MNITSPIPRSPVWCYPEVPGLVAIADYFGVSLDYLMGRTDVREINRGQP